MKVDREKCCTDVDEDDVKTQAYIRTLEVPLTFISLSVLCVISVVLIASVFLRPEGSYSLIDSQSSSQIASMEWTAEDAVWITCKYLSASFGASIFRQHVSLQQDGQCCVRDAQNLLNVSLKRLAHIPQNLIGRFNADDDDELVVDEYITVNDTNDDPTANEKPGVHLTGTFSKDTRQITWQNVAKANGLYLTEDCSEVKITRSGNYFLYATIVYTNRTFRSIPFSIFQGSKYGISKLEHVQEDVRRDTGNRIETWSLQRIAYLNKDDNVYVHLSMMNMPFVSTDQDVHIFGMFKL